MWRLFTWLLIAALSLGLEARADDNATNLLSSAGAGGYQNLTSAQQVAVECLLWDRLALMVGTANDTASTLLASANSGNYLALNPFQLQTISLLLLDRFSHLTFSNVTVSINMTNAANRFSGTFTNGIFSGNGFGLTNLTNIAWVAITNPPAIPTTNNLASTNYVQSYSDTNGAGIAAAKVATNNLVLPTTNGFISGLVASNSFYGTGNPSNFVTATITNGLATTNYVLTTATNVASALTNGLASIVYVNTATNGFVTSSITNGFATTNYVTNLVGIVTNTVTTNLVQQILNATNNALATATNSFAPKETLIVIGTNYTVQHTDMDIVATNGIILTLPTAVGYTNSITIMSTSTNVVSLATTSGQTIDGTILGSIASVTFASAGAHWRIGDIGTISGGNNGLVVATATNSTTGAITGYFTIGGYGYSVASGIDVPDQSIGGATDASLNITAVAAYVLSPQYDTVTLVSDGANWHTKVNRPAGLMPIGTVGFYFSGAFNISGTTMNSTPLTLPPEDVECDGQVITDRQSPMWNFTIPDVAGNGGQSRFLRGVPAASNNSQGTGGADTATVSITLPIGVGVSGGTTRNTTGTATISTLPSYVFATPFCRIK